jgi:amino-acid N-acetyltransferase
VNTTVRRARTADVRSIRQLVDQYAAQRILLFKEMVTLYEDVQEFWVAEEPAGSIIGCGALHVMWEDLAEVRTLATHPDWVGRGIGHAVLSTLLEVGRDLGISRVFCLTFEVDFFKRHGFEVVEGSVVPPDVYAELLRSDDEGVAEFLDLDRVKPNTLGNARMLLRLF